MSSPFEPLPLGVSLRVSPEMAESLRQKRTANNSTVLSEGAPLSEQAIIEEPFSSDAHIVEGSEEDWDDLLPLSLPPEQHLDDNDENESEQHVDTDADEDTDDDVSTSPPPSLPVVIVNLEKLCGYVPSTQEEARELCSQVYEALLQDDDDEGFDKEEESLSSHFENRVTELFDNQVAFHSDTCENQKWSNHLGYCIVDYPEFLCRSHDGRVMVTAREWKILLKPHGIAVVRRLFQNLQNCNRGLAWKVDMHQQLLLLARHQQEDRLKHEQNKELREWRTEGRRTKLDKLYQVRETFDHRLEMARHKLESLEQEREDEVKQELRRHAGGLEGLDFDSAAPFAFPEEDANDTRELQNQFIEESDEDEGYIQSDDEEFLSGDDSSLDDATNELVAASQKTRSRKRLNKKRRRQLLQSQAEAAKRELERAKVEKAMAEEEHVRKQSALTPQVHMAQAVVQSLEERMKQVDDLLESLQEEEWADEEEENQEKFGEPSCVETSNDKDNLSLLDQILAMILGALPQGDRSKEDHFKFVHEEHESIKKEWKDYFGRLPVSMAPSTNQDADVPNGSATGKPSKEEKLQHQMEQMTIAPTATHVGASPSVEMSVSDLKQTFGIVDVEGDWDDINDWDEVLPTTAVPESGLGPNHPQLSTASSTKEPRMGLRPGGKVER